MTGYSISVRLRRTTVEESYVSVPVTDAVMQEEPAEDESYGLDTDKLFAVAVELGRGAEWLPEEHQVHPVQKAPDDVLPQFDAER
ncbi:hypothetical protein AB0F71_31925 [Kitasatospora sp. NPDC028055]|uniref:hypothetical protein n=1 Tax=Kitasatospora sp. NPDC028055 TaxID=3155653 RepID=UPI003404B0EF